MQKVFIILAMLATAAAAFYCLIMRRSAIKKSMVETFVQK